MRLGTGPVCWRSTEGLDNVFVSRGQDSVVKQERHVSSYVSDVDDYFENMMHPKNNHSNNNTQICINGDPQSARVNNGGGFRDLAFSTLIPSRNAHDNEG
jgi:hypothetical protein